MIYYGDLDSIIPGSIVTILCKAEGAPFVSKTAQEVYVASVGLAKILIRGVFTHDFHTGSYYEVKGKYKISKGKKELDLYEYTLSYPTTNTLVFKMLSRLCTDSSFANKLMDTCGERVLFTLEESTEEILSLAQWNEDETNEILYISKGLKKKREKEPAVKLLFKYGISPIEVIRLLKKYGLDDILALNEEPYTILEMSILLNFKDVDRIALNDGYDLVGLGRLMAFALYCMRIAVESEGHTISSIAELRESFGKLISIPLGLKEAKAILKTGESSGDIPRRIQVGAQEILMDVKDLRSFYNVWESTPKGERGDFAYPLLNISTDIENLVFQSLEEQNKVHIIDKEGELFYQLDLYYQYEKVIATSLSDMKNSDKCPYPVSDIKYVLNTVLHKLSGEMGVSIILEPEQESAILGICGTPYGAYILTGPAGSGKTFVLKIIILVLTALRQKFKDLPVTSQVLAPTGRAVQVATKAIGEQGSTIHRHFRIGPEFDDVYTEHDDTLNIVDEFSMVDTAILAKMLMGLKGLCKLVLVGDPEQLQSVEAGNCLRDLINAKTIKHYHLKTAKRQSAKSGVLINANKIISGESIKSVVVNKDSSIDNSYIMPCNKDSEVLEKMKAFIGGLGLERFHKDLVQILCATKSDAIGVNALNFLAQSTLNPYKENSIDSEGKGYDRIKSQEQFKSKPLYLQVGDKVMNTANSYTLGIYEPNENGEFVVKIKTGVMNGEIGVISRIHRVRIAGTMARRVVVKFNDGYVLYDNASISNLTLAYAITIHKSQGSQWPIVISPIVKFSERMHTRNLLYTMFTRAETTCYLLGNLESIEKSIKNPSLNKRNTGLKIALRRT